MGRNTEPDIAMPNAPMISNLLMVKPICWIGVVLKLIRIPELADTEVAALKWIYGKLILDLKLIPLIHVPFPEHIDAKELNVETMILVRDTMEFVIRMVVILLLIVMEIKITGVKVLDLLLTQKPKKLLL